MLRSAGLVTALILAASAAPAAGDGHASLSMQALARYDYSLEVTRKGLNKLFALGTRLVERRGRIKPGPIKSLSVFMRGDGVTVVDARVDKGGLFDLHIEGRFSLEAADRFDFTIEALRVKDPDGNILKALSLRLVEVAVMTNALNRFFRRAKLTDFLELEFRGFSMFGTIGGFFGYERELRFKLKPKAFPSKVLANLHTIHASRKGERLVIQGVLKE